MKLMHLRRIGPRKSKPESSDIICFGENITLIGRNPSQVDYVLCSADKNQNSFISRIHACVLRNSDDKFILRDESRNGIFVNSFKINGRVELCEGDMVTFGHPNGASLTIGTRVRQPDSEYQFIFECCRCDPSSQNNTMAASRASPGFIQQSNQLTLSVPIKQERGPSTLSVKQEQPTPHSRKLDQNGRPAKVTLSDVTDTLAKVASIPTPTAISIAPTVDSPVPSTSSTFSTHVPRASTHTPVDSSQARTACSLSPTVSTLTPNADSLAPPVEPLAPKVSSPEPIVNSPPPSIKTTALSSCTPAQTISAPAQTGSSLAFSISAPVPSTSSLALSVGAPAQTVSAPAKTVCSPAISVSAPAPTTSSLALSSNLPAKTVSIPQVKPVISKIEDSFSSPHNVLLQVRQCEIQNAENVRRSPEENDKTAAKTNNNISTTAISTVENTDLSAINEKEDQRPPSQPQKSPILEFTKSDKPCDKNDLLSKPVLHEISVNTTHSQQQTLESPVKHVAKETDESIAVSTLSTVTLVNDVSMKITQVAHSAEADNTASVAKGESEILPKKNGINDVATECLDEKVNAPQPEQLPEQISSPEMHHAKHGASGILVRVGQHVDKADDTVSHEKPVASSVSELFTTESIPATSHLRVMDKLEIKETPLNKPDNKPFEIETIPEHVPASSKELPETETKVKEQNHDVGVSEYPLQRKDLNCVDREQISETENMLPLEISLENSENDLHDKECFSAHLEKHARELPMKGALIELQEAENITKMDTPVKGTDIATHEREQFVENEKLLEKKTCESIAMHKAEFTQEAEVWGLEAVRVEREDRDKKQNAYMFHDALMSDAMDTMAKIIDPEVHGRDVENTVPGQAKNAAVDRANMLEQEKLVMLENVNVPEAKISALEQTKLERSLIEIHGTEGQNEIPTGSGTSTGMREVIRNRQTREHETSEAKDSSAETPSIDKSEEERILELPEPMGALPEEAGKEMYERQPTDAIETTDGKSASFEQIDDVLQENQIDSDVLNLQTNDTDENKADIELCKQELDTESKSTEGEDKNTEYAEDEIHDKESTILEEDVAKVRTLTTYGPDFDWPETENDSQAASLGGNDARSDLIDTEIHGKEITAETESSKVLTKPTEKLNDEVAEREFEIEALMAKVSTIKSSDIEMLQNERIPAVKLSEVRESPTEKPELETPEDDSKPWAKLNEPKEHSSEETFLQITEKEHMSESMESNPEDISVEISVHELHGTEHIVESKATEAGETSIELNIKEHVVNHEPPTEFTKHDSHETDVPDKESPAIIEESIKLLDERVAHSNDLDLKETIVEVKVPELGETKPDKMMSQTDVTESEPGQTEPVVRTDVTEHELSETEPDVRTDVTEHELGETEPVVRTDVTEHELSETEPVVRTDVTEHELGEIEPDVRTDVTEHELGETEPVAVTDVTEHDLGETEPVMRTDVTEHELSETEPVVRTDVTEHELDETEPVVWTDFTEHELGEIEPDVRTDVTEHELGEIEPDGRTDVTEHKLGETEPVVRSDVTEHELGEIEPVVRTDVTEHELGEIEPDVRTDVTEHELGETEPVVVTDVTEHELGETEPVVRTAVTEHELGETEPVVRTDVQEHELSEIEPDVRTDVIAHELSETEPVVVTDVTEHELRETEPVVRTDVTEHELGETEPVGRTDVTEHALGETEPDVRTDVTEHELGETEPAMGTDVTAHEQGETEPVVRNDVTEHELGETEPVVRTDGTAHELGETEPVVRNDVTEHELGETEPDVRTDVTEHELGETEPVVVTDVTEHELDETEPDVRTDVTEHELGVTEPVAVTDVTEHELGEIEPVVRTDVTELELGETEPDVRTDVTEHELGETEPDVRTDVTEHELGETEPVVRMDATEHELGETEPDVMTDVTKHELGEIEPDVRTDVTEHELGEIEPVVRSDVTEHELGEIEPVVRTDVTEHELDEIEPDVRTDVTEHELGETEPVVVTDVTEHELGETEPVVRTDVTEHELGETEPVVRTDVKEHELSEIEPDVRTDVIAHELGETEPVVVTDVTEHELRETEPVVRTDVTEHELGETEPVLRTDVTEHALGETEPDVRTDVTEHELGETEPAMGTDVTAHEQGETEPVVRTDVTEHELGETEPVVRTDGTAHELGETEPVVRNDVTEHELGETEPDVRTDVTEHELGETEPVVVTDVTEHELGETEPVVVTDVTEHELDETEPDVRTDVTEHELGVTEPVAVTDVTEHELGEIEPVVRTDVTELELGETEPDVRTDVTEHELGETEPDVRTDVTEHELGETEHVVRTDVTEHELGETEPDVRTDVTKHELGEIEPDVRTDVTEHELGEIEPDVRKDDTEHELGETEPVVRTDVTEHELGETEPDVRTDVTEHELGEIKPDVRTDVTEHDLGEIEPVVGTDVTAHELGETEPVVRNDVTESDLGETEHVVRADVRENEKNAESKTETSFTETVRNIEIAQDSEKSFSTKRYGDRDSTDKVTPVRKVITGTENSLSEEFETRSEPKIEKIKQVETESNMIFEDRELNVPKVFLTVSKTEIAAPETDQAVMNCPQKDVDRAHETLISTGLFETKPDLKQKAAVEMPEMEPANELGISRVKHLHEEKIPVKQNETLDMHNLCESNVDEACNIQINETANEPFVSDIGVSGTTFDTSTGHEDNDIPKALDDTDETARENTFTVMSDKGSHSEVVIGTEIDVSKNYKLGNEIPQNNGENQESETVSIEELPKAEKSLGTFSDMAMSECLATSDVKVSHGSTTASALTRDKTLTECSEPKTPEIRTMIDDRYVTDNQNQQSSSKSLDVCSVPEMDPITDAIDSETGQSPEAKASPVAEIKNETRDFGETASVSSAEYLALPESRTKHLKEIESNHTDPQTEESSLIRKSEINHAPEYDKVDETLVGFDETEASLGSGGVRQGDEVLWDIAVDVSSTCAATNPTITSSLNNEGTITVVSNKGFSQKPDISHSISSQSQTLPIPEDPAEESAAKYSREKDKQSGEASNAPGDKSDLHLRREVFASSDVSMSNGQQSDISKSRPEKHVDAALEHQVLVDKSSVQLEDAESTNSLHEVEEEIELVKGDIGKDSAAQSDALMNSHTNRVAYSGGKEPRAVSTIQIGKEDLQVALAVNLGYTLLSLDTINSTPKSMFKAEPKSTKDTLAIQEICKPNPLQISNKDNVGHPPPIVTMPIQSLQSNMLKSDVESVKSKRIEILSTKKIGIIQETNKENARPIFKRPMVFPSEPPLKRHRGVSSFGRAPSFTPFASTFRRNKPVGFSRVTPSSFVQDNTVNTDSTEAEQGQFSDAESDEEVYSNVKPTLGKTDDLKGSRGQHDKFDEPDSKRLKVDIESGKISQQTREVSADEVLKYESDKPGTSNGTHLPCSINFNEQRKNPDEQVMETIPKNDIAQSIDDSSKDSDVAKTDSMTEPSLDVIDFKKQTDDINNDKKTEHSSTFSCRPFVEKRKRPDSDDDENDEPSKEFEQKGKRALITETNHPKSEEIIDDKRAIDSGAKEKAAPSDEYISFSQRDTLCLYLEPSQQIATQPSESKAQNQAEVLAPENRHDFLEGEKSPIFSSTQVNMFDDHLVAEETFNQETAGNSSLIENVTQQEQSDFRERPQDTKIKDYVHSIQSHEMHLQSDQGEATNKIPIQLKTKKSTTCSTCTLSQSETTKIHASESLESKDIHPVLSLSPELRQVVQSETDIKVPETEGKQKDISLSTPSEMENRKEEISISPADEVVHRHPVPCDLNNSEAKGADQAEYKSPVKKHEDPNKSVSPENISSDRCLEGSPDSYQSPIPVTPESGEDKPHFSEIKFPVIDLKSSSSSDFESIELRFIERSNSPEFDKPASPIVRSLSPDMVELNNYSDSSPVLQTATERKKEFSDEETKCLLPDMKEFGESNSKDICESIDVSMDKDNALIAENALETTQPSKINTDQHADSTFENIEEGSGLEQERNECDVTHESITGSDVHSDSGHSRDEFDATLERIPENETEVDEVNNESDVTHESIAAVGLHDFDETEHIGKELDVTREGIDENDLHEEGDIEHLCNEHDITHDSSATSGSHDLDKTQECVELNDLQETHDTEHSSNEHDVTLESIAENMPQTDEAKEYENADTLQEDNQNKLDKKNRELANENDITVSNDINQDHEEGEDVGDAADANVSNLLGLGDIGDPQDLLLSQDCVPSRSQENDNYEYSQEIPICNHISSAANIRNGVYSPEIPLQRGTTAENQEALDNEHEKDKANEAIRCEFDNDSNLEFEAPVVDMGALESSRSTSVLSDCLVSHSDKSAGNSRCSPIDDTHADHENSSQDNNTNQSDQQLNAHESEVRDNDHSNNGLPASSGLQTLDSAQGPYEYDDHTDKTDAAGKDKENGDEGNMGNESQSELQYFVLESETTDNENVIPTSEATENGDRIVTNDYTYPKETRIIQPIPDDEAIETSNQNVELNKSISCEDIFTSSSQTRESAATVDFEMDNFQPDIFEQDSPLYTSHSDANLDNDGDVGRDENVSTRRDVRSSEVEQAELNLSKFEVIGSISEVPQDTNKNKNIQHCPTTESVAQSSSSHDIVHNVKAEDVLARIRERRNRRSADPTPEPTVPDLPLDNENVTMNSSQESTSSIYRGGEPSQLPLENLAGNLTLQNVDRLMSRARSVLGDLKIMLNVATRQDVGKGVESNPRVRAWCAQLEQQIQRASQLPQTVIAVVGNTGSGKSSLMNALLDHSDVLPTSGLRACTAVVVQITDNSRTDHLYEAEIEFLSQKEWETEVKILLAELKTNDGKIKTRQPTDKQTEEGIAWCKLRAVYGPFSDKVNLLQLTGDKTVTKWLGKTKHVTAQTPAEFTDKVNKYIENTDRFDGGEFWPIVKHVKLQIPGCAALKSGATLVDLPGVRDSNAARDKIARDFLQHCTAVWVVAEIHRAVSDRTAKNLLGEHFRRQLLMDGQYGSVTYVCTKTDACLIAAEISRQLQEIEDQVKSIIVDIKAKDRLVTTANGEIVELKHQLKLVTQNIQVCEDTLKELSLEVDELNATLDKEGTDISAVSEEIIRVQKEVAKQTEEIESLKKKEEQFDKEKAIKINENLAIEKDISTLRTEMNLICAQARNEYAKQQIKRDFRAGLKEMKRSASLRAAGIEEIESISDDDDDVTSEDKLTVENLRVFCVSAADYLKLRGQICDSPAVFHRKRDTEIPSLQRFIDDITCVRKIRGTAKLLRNIGLFVSDILNYLIDKGTKDKRLRTEVKQSIAQISADVRAGAMSDVIGSTNESIDQLISRAISPKVREGCDLANDKALEVCAKWGSKPNADRSKPGGLHWSTYKAVVQRQGVYHSATIGPIDFNADLAAPIYTSIMLEWDRLFNTEMCQILDDFHAEVSKVVKQLAQEVKNRLLELGLQNERVHRAYIHHMCSARHRVNQSIEELKAYITERQRIINRVLSPAIQESLNPAYGMCAQEKGSGSFQRMKDHMRSFIDSHKEPMFDNATQRLLQGLVELQNDITRQLWGVFDVLHEDMMAIYEPLWENPKHGKHLRDHFQQGVKVCYEQITQVLQDAGLESDFVHQVAQREEDDENDFFFTQNTKEIAKSVQEKMAAEIYGNTMPDLDEYKEKDEYEAMDVADGSQKLAKKRKHKATKDVISGESSFTDKAVSMKKIKEGREKVKNTDWKETINWKENIAGPKRKRFKTTVKRDAVKSNAHSKSTENVDPKVLATATNVKVARSSYMDVSPAEVDKNSPDTACYPAPDDILLSKRTYLTQEFQSEAYQDKNDSDSDYFPGMLAISKTQSNRTSGAENHTYGSDSADLFKRATLHLKSSRESKSLKASRSRGSRRDTVSPLTVEYKDRVVDETQVDDVNARKEKIKSKRYCKSCNAVQYDDKPCSVCEARENSKRHADSQPSHAFTKKLKFKKTGKEKSKKRSSVLQSEVDINAKTSYAKPLASQSVGRPGSMYEEDQTVQALQTTVDQVPRGHLSQKQLQNVMRNVEHNISVTAVTPTTQPQIHNQTYDLPRGQASCDDANVQYGDGEMTQKADDSLRNRRCMLRVGMIKTEKEPFTYQPISFVNPDKAPPVKQKKKKDDSVVIDLT